MEDPGVFLDEAAELWLSSRATYRDALLRVGGLLQRFLLAKAAQAAGLSSREAVSADKCREDAVAEATLRLKTVRNRVYTLVATTRAVALLSGGFGVGELSYSALAAFRGTVARRTGLGGGKHYRRGEETLEYRLAREEWQVKPGLPYDPGRLFRAAVEEDWTTSDVRRAVATGRTRLGPTHEGMLDEPVTPARLAELAKNASPRDLAEIIVKLICGSSDPEAVRRAVLAAAVVTASASTPVTWTS